MLIPKNVKTRNKIRDAKICIMYTREEQSVDAIAHRFGISQQRVNQILQRNSHLLSFDKNWERAKQVKRILEQIKIKRKKPSKRDLLDWEAFLEKRVEDKEDRTGSRETNIIVIRSSDDQQRISLRREGVTVDRTSTTEAQGADKAQAVSG